MADGVKGCYPIQDDEDNEASGVCREEEVIGDFQRCCFSAVIRA